MSTDLGRVSLVGKGEYSPTTQYERLDVVRYNGAAYLVLKDVKGVTPAAGANYMLLVEDGADGAQGPQGEPGQGSSIELPLSIDNGGTGGTTATIALSNLLSAVSTDVSPSKYSDIYVPIYYNGICYKISFSRVLTWTVNRSNSAYQADTNYTTFMARGIAAGTSDYTAGTTTMTDGTIYLVYE